MIAACPMMRLAFNDEGGPYIVPMNFGYENRDGQRVFYFHCAKEGRKMELIRRCPQAGFEMDTGYALRRGDTACAYSAAFASLIGTGDIRLVGQKEEKRAALALLMRHTAGDGPWTFEDRQVDAVTVFRLDVRQLSCKEHL